jgi:hypothetical protein
MKMTQATTELYVRGTQLLLVNRHGTQQEFWRLYAPGQLVRDTESSSGTSGTPIPPPNNVDPVRYLRTSVVGSNKIDYIMNVFINGTFVQAIAPPQPINAEEGEFQDGLWVSTAGIANYSPISTTYIIDLISEVNDVVLSKGVIDDPNSLHFKVCVIPDVTVTSINPKNTPFGNTVEVYDLANITAFRYAELNRLALAVYGPPLAVKLFTPIEHTSYQQGTFTYVDKYGRLISPSSTQPNVEAGTFSDTLVLSPNKPTFYDKIQGYWQAMDGGATGDFIPDGVIIYEDGRIGVDDTVEGSVKFYPLTSMGYTELTIIVNEEILDLTYYTYPNVGVNLTALEGIDATTSSGDSLVNGVITLTSSKKVSYKNYRFNIVVIQLPAPQTIKVAKGDLYTYDLAHLIGAPSEITSDLLYATADSNPINPIAGKVFWPTASTSGDISFKPTPLSDEQKLATIEPVTLNITINTIYARIGETVNLFDYIQPIHTGDTLLYVKESVVSQPNGDLKFTANLSSIDCTFMLLGVEVSHTIPVVIVPDNAERKYITSNAYTDITLDAGKNFIIIDSNGKHIIINGVTENKYARIEVPSFNAHSSTYRIYVKEEFLLYVHEKTGTNLGDPSNPTVYQMIPLPSMSFEDITIVRNSSGEAVLDLPYGPKYEMGTTLTYRGGKVSFTAPLAEYTIIIPDIDDGTKTIKVNVVDGTIQSIGLVHSYLLSGASVVGALPSYATDTGSDILITRQTDMNATLTANIGGVAKQYNINLLPMVSMSQILYITPSMKYSDILPTDGYTYNATITGNLSSGALAEKGEISFSYGEYDGTTGNKPQGKITLVEYTGTIVNKEIYMSVLIPNVVELHKPGSGVASSPASAGGGASGGDLLTLPYSSNGVTFLVEAGGIRVNKDNKDIDVGQYLLVSIPNVSTEPTKKVGALYNFRTVPGPSHNDVYVYNDTNGNASWKTDHDVVIDSTPIAKGDTYTLSAGDDTVVAILDFPPSSVFYKSQASFNIVRVSSITTVDVVDEVTIPATSGFQMVGLDSNSLQTVTGTIHLQTADLQFIVDETNIKASKTKLGSSQLLANDGGKHDLLRFVTHDLPLSGTQHMDYYDGSPAPSILATGMTDITINGTASTSGDLVDGTNAIEYTYYGKIGNNATVHLRKVPVPSTVDAERIVPINTVQRVDGFGLNGTYWIQSVVVNKIVGTTSTLATAGEFTTSFTSSQLTFTALEATVMPGDDNKFEMLITLISTPSDKLPSTSVQAKIDVYSWDPATVKSTFAHTTPSTSGTPISATIYGVANASVELEGDLKHIESNGAVYNMNSQSGLLRSINVTGESVVIYSQKSAVQSFLVYTTKEVFLLTIFIIKSSISLGELKFPMATPPAIPSPITVNLLELGFPGLEDEMTDGGVDRGLLTYAVPFASGLQSINVMIGTTQISTLTYTPKQVSLPTLVVNDPEFVFEINKSFEVKSSMVSVDSELKATNLTTLATNGSISNQSPPAGGFVVNINTPGDYSIPCELTRDGTTTLVVSVKLVAYDPADTTSTHITQYSPNYTATFSDEITGYSVDGVSYGLVASKYVSLPSPLPVQNEELIITLTKEYRDIIVIAKLKNGKTEIFRVTYKAIEGTAFRQYLIPNESSVTITGAQLSNVVSGDNPTVVYNPPAPVPPLETEGYPVFSNDGSKVGWARIDSIGNLRVRPNQPGVWVIGGVSVQVGSVIAPVDIYVETLSSIILAPQNIQVDTGNSINIDANNFVVSGLGEVIFRDWKMNNLNLPPSISHLKGIIKSAPLTSGTYAFSATVQSAKRAALTDTLNFTLTVVDSGSSEEWNVVLVENLTSTITFPSAVISVNSANRTTLNIMVDNVSIKFSADAKTATFSSKITLGHSISMKMITQDGKINFVSVTQIQQEKDIAIAGLDYKGNIFKSQDTSGHKVVSYTAEIGGVSNPQTYLAGTVYSIAGGSIVIEEDGSFEFSNVSTAKIIVSYTTNNGQNTHSLTMNIGGNPHPVRVIELSPPTSISLGSDVVRVTVNGSELANGATIQLTYIPPSSTTTITYGAITRSGNSITVSGANDSFQPTLVQAENILGNVVNVVSMIIDIDRDDNTQLIYDVPAGEKLTFALSYIPTKVSYNTMIYNGANVKLLLFSQGKQIATLQVSGTSLEITTSEGASGISDPIGFMDNKGKYVYGLVRVSKSTSINTTPVKLGDTIQAPQDLTFETIGTMGLLTPETVIGTGTLAGRVQLLPTHLIIISSALTETFRFYATMSDETTRYYEIRFVEKEVFVKDPKKFLARSLLGSTDGALVFSTPNVSVSGLFVLNPSATMLLITTSPFYGRFTLNIV